MKSLSESLFDTGLAEKDLKIKDFYDTYTVSYSNLLDFETYVLKFFDRKRLEKANFPNISIDMSGIPGRLDDKLREALDVYKLVVGALLEMPMDIIFGNKYKHISFINHAVEDYLLQYCYPRYQKQTSNREFDAWVSLNNDDFVTFRLSGRRSSVVSIPFKKK